jgi:hypothetical protein
VQSGRVVGAVSHCMEGVSPCMDLDQLLHLQIVALTTVLTTTLTTALTTTLSHLAIISVASLSS